MNREQIYEEALSFLQDIDYPDLTLDQLIVYIEEQRNYKKHSKQAIVDDIRRLFEQFIEDRLSHCCGNDDYEGLLEFFTKYTSN